MKHPAASSDSIEDVRAPQDDASVTVRPTNVPVGLLVCGLVAVVAGVLVSKAFEQPSLLVLVVGAVLAGALCLLAMTRFSLFLIVLVVLRASLDVLKPGGIDGTSPLAPGVLVGGVLLLASGLWLLSERAAGRLVRPSRTAMWLFAVACAAVLSSVGSQTPTDSVQTAARVFAGALTFIVLEQLLARRPAYVRGLLAAAGFSLLLPAILAFEQLVRPDELFVYTDVSRIQGTFVHPNSFAAYLVVVAATAVAVVFLSRGATRSVAFVVCAVASTLVLFTYARGAWVAWIVGMLYLLAQRNRKLVYALIAGGVAVVLLVPSINSRVSDLGGAPAAEIGDGTSNSMEWRIQYWQEVLPFAQENPVTGIGIDQTSTRTEAALEPHSGFVQALVETGILGFVALIGLIVALWRDLAAARRRAVSDVDRWLVLGATAVAAGFLLQLFTENLLTQVAIHLYLWIPIAYATSTLLRDPRQGVRSVRSAATTGSVPR
jgi:putative inorganic carbon (hco3(-)) transporter